MPTAELIVDGKIFAALQRHLAGGKSGEEEAAFLFCDINEQNSVTQFTLREVRYLQPEAFASRSRFYLELSDDTRAALIKRAHDLGCGLVEMHSHPGQEHAEFSWSDLSGFEEFVPHVRWRLKGRPYMAIVCGRANFDGLAWTGDSTSHSGDVVLVVDGKRLWPTGKTIAQARYTDE